MPTVAGRKFYNAEAVNLQNCKITYTDSVKVSIKQVYKMYEGTGGMERILYASLTTTL
jgi:hypothetical protein